VSRLGDVGLSALVMVALAVGLLASERVVIGPRGTAGVGDDAAEIPTTGESTTLVGPAPVGRVGRALQVAIVLACPLWCLLMPGLERWGWRRRLARHRESGLCGPGSDRELGRLESPCPEVRPAKATG
jgi:hypothetical protein